MDNKKLLLGLTVLATPFVVENLVETNVASANQSVATAKKQSTTATTQAASKQTATAATTSVAKSSEYVLATPAKAYVTANDAAQRVNQKATYKPGSYYVYNQNKGMVNISNATGKAGSWINPIDNPNAKKTVQQTQPVVKPQPVTTTQTKQKSTKPVENKTTQTVQQATTQTPKSTNLTLVAPKAGQYSLLKSTDAYINAVDASKKVNPKGKVSVGNYYIFREYKGMLNVTRTQGKVGSWINPTSTIIANPTKTTQETQPVTTTQTTKPTTPEVTQEKTSGYKTNGMFTLTSPTEVYINAIDASKKTNARGRASAGSYHIFREYRGMLNISRAQGKAGSWINPGLVEEPKQTTQTTASQTKPNVQETKQTKTEEKSTGYKTNGLFALTSATEAYINAIDASKKVNARGRVAAGNYHIFREYKGMLNISKAKGLAGSWINPGLVTTTSTTAPVKPESTKPAQTETKTTNTQEKTVGSKTSTGTFRLNRSTEAYISSADANKKVNARGMLAAGDYHIFREYKGMLNISKAKGKVGSWINPNGKVADSTGSSKLPETAASTKEVSGTGVKYYTQDKAPWSSKRYGLSNMHHTGCVPTSLAMAISTLSKTVTPEQVANYLWYNTDSFNKKVQGTISTGITKALNHYGLKYKVVNTKTGLDSELGKGNMVLSLVQGAQFITPGYTHAVIAKGLDKLGRTTVYNPYSTYGIKKFATNTLFKSQSQDRDDRRLGGTFISIFK